MEIEREHFCFNYVDGSKCPHLCNGWYSGACLCARYWKHGQPESCKTGSKCVRLIAADLKVNNDVMCDDTLQAVLCNPCGSNHAFDENYEL